MATLFEQLSHFQMMEAIRYNLTKLRNGSVSAVLEMTERLVQEEVANDVAALHSALVAELLSISKRSPVAAIRHLREHYEGICADSSLSRCKAVVDAIRKVG